MGRVTMGPKKTDKKAKKKEGELIQQPEPVIVEKIVQDPHTPKAIEKLRQAHASDIEKVYNVLSEQREQLARDISITDEKLEEMYDELMNEVKTAPEKLEIASYDDSEVVRVLNAQGHAMVDLRALTGSHKEDIARLKEELNKQKKINKYFIYGSVLLILLSLTGIIL